MKIFTDEWATALSEALDADEKFQKATRKRKNDVLVFRVSDTPDGDVVYHMLVNEGTAQVGLGEPSVDATCNIDMDYETAQKMAKGKLNGQQASMTGKLKTDLPITKMIAIAPVLEARQKVEKTLGVES